MILATALYLALFAACLLLALSLCAAAKRGDRQLNIGDEA